jgi:riboflavin biosynthesis pyrimidine reductase
VSLRQLFPVAPDAQVQPDLAALYAYPDGQWLRANMVSTADGAASLNGVTQGISSDADRQVFALLRALCDVILIGAATAREEKYKPARPRELWAHLRDGRPRTPPIAVVSRRLDIDPDSPLITAAPAHARTLVITTADSPADVRAELARHADVVIAGEEVVDIKLAVTVLAHRGHRRILTEGGPHLLAQLVQVGLLDELCLTVSPLMAGPGAARIVAGALLAGQPLPLTLAHVLEDDGFLLCRYIRDNH